MEFEDDGNKSTFGRWLSQEISELPPPSSYVKLSETARVRFVCGQSSKSNGCDGEVTKKRHRSYASYHRSMDLDAPRLSTTALG